MLLAGNITSEEAPTQRTQMELWPEEKWTDLKKLRKSKAVSSEKPTVQMGDIHEASRKGDAVAVNRILYQDPEAMHAKDSDGNIPLSCAAEEGHADVAEVLLSHGAEVDAHRGRTVLRFAAYWVSYGDFSTQSNEQFQATLTSVNGQRIPTGKDFDTTTGQLKNDDCVVLDEPAVQVLAERLRNAEFHVISLE